MKTIPVMIVAGVVVAAGAGLLLYGTDSGTPSGIDVTNTDQVALGKALYARECAACHGKELQGQTRDWRRRLPDGSLPAPPHNAAGHTWHHPDEVLFEVTKYGRLRAAPATVRSNMPAFEQKLSDGEIWAVLSYIKSRWPDAIQRRHDGLNKRYQAQR